MRMTIRQVSDLIDGTVVGERTYCSDSPPHLLDVLRLVLSNCSDFMKSEGIRMDDNAVQLESLTLTYRGMAGAIEVIFPRGGTTP